MTTTIKIDLRQISGLVPDVENLKNARIDFSPFTRWHVEDGDEDYWLTRNILRVKAPHGLTSVPIPAPPAGKGYEVQERGFRGARHGYVIFDDVEEINYADITWVDKDTLDPEAPPSPAWLAALAQVQAELEAAGDAVTAAQDSADAAQSTANGAVSGLATKVNTSTYTAGLFLKQDTATLPAALATEITTPGTPANEAVTAKISADTSRDLSTAVLLGDSRTQFNGGWNAAGTIGTSIIKQDRGYVTLALVTLRQRLRVLKNGGVGGDTTAQMLARTDALLALNPGILIGFGCVNSITDGVSAASIIADFTAIFDKATARGVRIVWGTDWYTPTHDAPKRAEMDKVNLWLRDLSVSRPDFYLVDYAAVMSDPVDGMALATLSSDRVHQDPNGAAVMATQLVRVLESRIPPSDRLTASGRDSTNLLLNGMLAGDAGAGRATDWTGGSGAGAITYSKVARTDGYPGEWQQCVVAGVTSDSRSLRQELTTGWAIGDAVFGELEFQTDADGWAATQFYLRVQMISATASPFLAMDLAHDAAGANFTTRLPDGILRTPRIVIPAGTANIRFALILVGSGTFRAARARLAKVV